MPDRQLIEIYQLILEAAGDEAPEYIRPIERMAAALHRIASMPTEPRPDGTYNISREALIDIARRGTGVDDD